MTSESRWSRLSLSQISQISVIYQPVYAHELTHVLFASEDSEDSADDDSDTIDLTDVSETLPNSQWEL